MSDWKGQKATLEVFAFERGGKHLPEFDKQVYLDTDTITDYLEEFRFSEGGVAILVTPGWKTDGREA